MTQPVADQLGVWKLPPNLRSCFNARGYYDPLRFVVRLRPDIRRRLEALEPGVRNSGEISDDIRLIGYRLRSPRTLGQSPHQHQTSSVGESTFWTRTGSAHKNGSPATQEMPPHGLGYS